MANEALTRFRTNTFRDEMASMAEAHFEPDLTEYDRATLKTAAGKVESHTTVGNFLGLGLGALLAYRVRRTRTKVLDAFRVRERPMWVRFADGRQEKVPDLNPILKPRFLTNLTTSIFLSLGGLFLGGEVGLTSGVISMIRTTKKDYDSFKRIGEASIIFRAETLRGELDMVLVLQTIAGRAAFLRTHGVGKA